MRLLFDQGTPAPPRDHLPLHSVDTLAEKGWSDKDNGELLGLTRRLRERTMEIKDWSSTGARSALYGN